MLRYQIPILVPRLNSICRLQGNDKNHEESQLTFRAVGAGLLVGSLLCCSNTYFGLQTGWVTMGSLQVRLAVTLMLLYITFTPAEILHACVCVWMQSAVQ